MKYRLKGFRILINTLLSTLIFIIGLIITYQLARTSYTYTSQVIESEAKRTTNKVVNKTTLTVTAHSTLDDIATTLFTEGLITDSNYFKIEAKLDTKFQQGQPTFIPGEYVLSSNMSSSEMLSLLTTTVSTATDTIKFTIPEGYTIDRIAELLESKGIVSKLEFIDAVTNKQFESDYTFLRDIPSHPNYKYKLEGYLFPDTYIVRKNVTAEELIVMMLNRFEDIMSRYTLYISNSNYTLHELLTMASIIEQEAKLDEERPLISGVIYNRLSSGMRLQMCSSVQYSLNKRKANLTTNDLQKESPYNTYLYDGLPIGPICNPGEACLKSAILPTEHNYYYFVLKNATTGEHAFSETNAQHLAAKQTYQQVDDVNFS